MPARSLLDLPTEVRLLIFEHLYRLSEATLHIGQSDRCDLIQDGHSSRSLLRTNKLIREEAMPVFLERTTFVLSCSRCRGWDGNCYDLPNIRNVITDRRLADGIVKRFLYLCAAKHLRLNSLVIRNKLVVPSQHSELQGQNLVSRLTSAIQVTNKLSMPVFIVDLPFQRMRRSQLHCDMTVKRGRHVVLAGASRACMEGVMEELLGVGLFDKDDFEIVERSMDESLKIFEQYESRRRMWRRT